MDWCYRIAIIGKIIHTKFPLGVASGLWSDKFDSSFHIAGKKKFVELFVDNEFAYFYTKNKIRDIHSANNLIMQHTVGNVYDYFIFANRSAMLLLDKNLSFIDWADEIREGYNTKKVNPNNPPAIPKGDEVGDAREYLLSTDGLKTSMGSVFNSSNIFIPPEKHDTALTNIPKNDYLLNKSYLWLNLTLEPFLDKKISFTKSNSPNPLGEKITTGVDPDKIDSLLENRYTYALGSFIKID